MSGRVGAAGSRTALQRARVFAGALLATGVVTATIGTGVQALQSDADELLVEREGGGRVLLATGLGTCWRVVGTQRGDDSVSTSTADVFERRGCGDASLDLPRETVFEAVHLHVEKNSVDSSGDAVALVWAGRQVLNGALVADTDTVRAQAYGLSLEHPDGVLVTVDGAEERVSGDYAAPLGVGVVGKARATAERLDLDPDLRVDAFAPLSRTFAGRHVADEDLLRKDMAKARRLTRSALAYRTFLEEVQQRDVRAVAAWLDDAATGKHGDALAARADGWRTKVAPRLWAGLERSVARATKGSEDLAASWWAARIGDLDAVTALDPALSGEVAAVRWQWEEQRAQALEREAELRAEQERLRAEQDAD